MSESSRYVVGLDLGTTNSAVSFIDTSKMVDERFEIQNLAIDQLVQAGEVGAESLLPSFLYLPAAGEFDKAQLQTPWSKDAAFAVGKFAREQGASVPTRLVSSAKSWLCHPEADRRGALLPWLAEEGFAKISPVEASARILTHLRDAWNFKVAGKDKAARLENQDIVLTTPASFDAVARELTLEAARQAGLERITLFEEPQAAFYSWIHAAGDNWRKQSKPGDVALVVDVGGGTTDLTLIAVAEQQGELTLNRIAVGDHLLLGGDNMDWTLAHAVARGLAEKGTKVDAVQMLALCHASRQAKEKLFENPKLKSQAITILGKGRKVVGGAIRAELTREQMEEILVEGFFPKVALGTVATRQRSGGLQELGLSFAGDAAITRHLSEFLSRHEDAIREASGTRKSATPNAILFNGGVFQAEVLRQRVLEIVGSWSKKSGDGPRELPAAGLDRAVAQGAAYFGMVRRGRGVRIRGGVARSYYVGVEIAGPAVPGMPPAIKALCVVPQGTEEGTEAEVSNREFGLIVGEKVHFRFLSSTQRRDDRVGNLLEDWEDTIQELAPLEAAFDAKEVSGQVVPVRLHCKVTDVGTLEIWFENRDRKQRWKLEFNVREPADA